MNECGQKNGNRQTDQIKTIKNANTLTKITQNLENRNAQLVHTVMFEITFVNQKDTQ